MSRFGLLVASTSMVVAVSTDANSSLYVFGYGSLLNQFSRIRTLCGLSDMTETELAFFDRFVQMDDEVRRCIDQGKERELILVKAQGVRRGWYSPGRLQYSRFGDEFSVKRMRGQALDVVPTYLGAVEDPSATTYAVMYPVTAEELAATDEREAGGYYTASWLDVSELEVLSQNVVLPQGAQVRWYALDHGAVQLPTPVAPICQSYVDIFVSGALELEKASGSEGFAKSVVASTADWSENWVNDRITPFRPFAKNSGSTAITRTLEEAALMERSHLKKEHLESIYFPGAQSKSAPTPAPQTMDSSGAQSRGAFMVVLACLNLFMILRLMF